MKKYVGGFELQGVLVSNWVDQGLETSSVLVGSGDKNAQNEAKLDIGYDIWYNGVEMYERRAEHCFGITEDILERAKYMFEIRSKSD